MSARGKKLNKTKRGGPRTFTNVEEAGDPWEQGRRRNDDSDSDDSDASNSGNAIADVDSETLPKVPEFGKIEEVAPAEEFKQNNANRAATKHIKPSELGSSDAVPMSRKEREALEAERKKAAWWKAQEEGKTDQARADLARLAIIKKQREEAARKKAEEAAAKSSGSASKAASLNAGKGIISKTLGKK